LYTDSEYGTRSDPIAINDDHHHGEGGGGGDGGREIRQSIY